MNRAVFLDRDGVLIEDVHRLTHAGQLRLLPGVPGTLALMRAAGFFLVVVTNQPVVARGFVGELGVVVVHQALEQMIVLAGGPRFDRIFFCPHHPNATLPDYRVNCDCRKPKSGMLLRAKRELDLDLSACYMVGDRITDIISGARVGCCTVLVESGQHEAVPIETVEAIDLAIQPDHTCVDLNHAADWILNHK